MRHHRITQLAATITITAGLLAGTGAAGAAATQAGELARLDALYAAASDASPAQFRLLEERQRIAGDGAQPLGEIAQFRAVEDGRR